MAAKDRVRIRLASGRLHVELGAHSALLQGEHRAYLVNVLGLESAEDWTGYVAPHEDGFQSHLVQEVLDYLTSVGADLDYDAAGSEFAARLAGEEANLESSRRAGLDAKTNPVSEITIPGFKRELKPYQIPAVHHLVQAGNAANFSVPGSGKTTMVLAAASVLLSRHLIERILVVAPRSAFMPWEEEFFGCFGRQARSVRIVGPRANRQKLYRQKIADAEIILITYHMASNDAEDLADLMKRHKVLLVLDESHNIKRLAGGKWAETLLDLAPLAARRVILSGTPVPNSLSDIWSQVAFLWPSNPILGSRERFKQLGPDEEDERVVEVQERLRPFYWRIKKSDLKLRKPKFHWYEVPMAPYQSAIYQALAAKVLADVVHAPKERAQLQTWRRARLIRLLQAASNPSLLAEHSVEFRIPPLSATGLPIDQLIANYSDYEVPAKLHAVEKHVRTLVKRGHKVLVWSAFIYNIKALQKMLGDLTVDAIYGEVPRDDNEDEDKNREKIIRDFKAAKEPCVLIANPAACAESISLHRECQHAIYLDRTFNASHYMQSLDRIHRIGLDPDTKVHYYIFQSAGTIDEVVDERLEHKKQRMLKLLDDDFAVLDLDSPEDMVSEEGELEADFAALMKSLGAKVRVAG